MSRVGELSGQSSPALRIVHFRCAGRRIAAIVEDRWPAPIGVSNAERDVARLLRTGLSNAEIARARGTAARTVANQIASLMRKLGVGTRLEIALSFAPVDDEI